MLRQNAPLTPVPAAPQYIVQYIRQPQRIRAAGASPAASSSQRQCARRRPAKAEPARAALACCPAGSHVSPGGEPVVESRCDDDGVPTGQEVSERHQPRSRGGNRGLVLTGLDDLAHLHSRLHGSGPARRGRALVAAWTVADALSVAGVAAGAAWAPRMDSAARLLQPARVRNIPAVVVAFAEVAAAWLAKARAAPVERDNRRAVVARNAVRRYVPQALEWRFRAFADERRMADLVVKLELNNEAERRAAERAVVDNMKDAYVSVLAPSQLSVDISAGDSVPIHCVGPIAEKLGPRAVI
eukprot:jgi/Tetstr1/428477/TSEL_018488.t1